MTSTAYQLSKSEVHQYLDHGYLSPYTLCSPEEMADIRKKVEKVLSTPPPFKSQPTQSRHLDQRVIYDLCSHPAILDRMSGILGEDLALWRSNFFQKDPGGKSVPWHQDANYWPIEPPINMTAWLAIDEAVVENSCVQIIPGSHKKVVPHISTNKDDTKLFKEEADPNYFDKNKAIPMELKPGQFFLFNERLLHYSAPNTSDKRRIGLSVRMTVPNVKVYHDELFEGHKVLLVKGRDRFDLNQLGNPPVK